MLGKTHVPVGITTALIATRPTTVSGVIGAVAGGAIGGWICDIDVRDSSKNEGGVVGFIFMVIDVGAALAVDYILGNGICDYMLHSFNLLNIIAAVLFVAGCFYGIATCHRTFMHSIVALVLFSVLTYFICEPLCIPFAAGYISHIVLDLFNRRGMQLFFPLKARVSFDVCDSDADANRIIGGGAVGGYLIMILTNGKKHLPHFAVGLPVMMAVHALLIAYLVYNGIM